jgi:hypothetical protein
MTRKSSHSPIPPPPALAAIVICNKQLLITERSTADGTGGKSGSNLVSLSVRSIRMTGILSHIEGYNHYGIND